MAKKKRSKKLTLIQRANAEIKMLKHKLKVERAVNAKLGQTIALEQSKVTQAQRNYERENQYKIDMQKEKDRYYTESNQKTAKIARLETIVHSLREGAQKMLNGFNTLN